MFDNDALLNRLDQLEAKNEQQDIKVAELEAKVMEHDADAAEQEVKVAGLETKVAEQELKINSHEMKINSQQEEIDQLKKRNSELIEEQKNQLVQAGIDAVSRDFLPRSCFELKATNPTAQSGVYSIDPDGQIGADPSILVYCDMATRNRLVFNLLNTSHI